MPALFLKNKIFTAFCHAVFTILFFSSYQRATVSSVPIVLHPPAVLFNTKEFYLDDLIDERVDKSAIAWIFPPPVSKQKPVLQTVDLQGGGYKSIRNFMLQSFPQNTKLRPIIVQLKECKITETMVAPGRVEGKVALALSFSLKDGDAQIELTNYRIDTKYNRPNNQLNMAEPALHESLSSALKYFNNWMNAQAAHNPKLAREVKVFFKDYHEKIEGDTIYYAANRPLRWDDFQEKPRNSKYAATVFPSFGFDQQREVVNGQIRLYLDLKVYVPKSACWVKDYNRDDYTLNHEQRHFDLVEIIGKRFQQKVLSEKLSVHNFDGPINVDFYEFFGQMNRLQDQYDAETQHGINSSQQEKWNKRIDQDLANLGVKNSS